MHGMRQKNSKLTDSRLIHVAAVLAIAVLVAGCGSVPKASHQSAVRATQAAPEQSDDAYIGSDLLLVGYVHDGSFIPIEPGHGSSTKIVFGADGTLSGYSGFTIFSGTWKTGPKRADESRDCSILVIPPKGRTTPDAIAARFEQDFFNELAAARKLKKEKDFILLLGSRNEVLQRFMVAAAQTSD